MVGRAMTLTVTPRSKICRVRCGAVPPTNCGSKTRKESGTLRFRTSLTSADPDMVHAEEHKLCRYGKIYMLPHWVISIVVLGFRVTGTAFLELVHLGCVCATLGRSFPDRTSQPASA